MKQWWYLVGILLLALSLNGQELPRVLHYPKATYGAQNQNWAITQATDGTMFFANNAGVLAFDGATWSLFSLPDGQVVRSVAYLNNRLYAGGFGEFGYFEPNVTTGWRYQSLAQTLKSGSIQREEIWHIIAQGGPRSKVLFQTFGKIFNYDGQATKELQPPSNLMFIQQVGQRQVFQGIGQGLFELLPDRSFRFLDGSEVLKNVIVAFILADGEGMLVGTKNDGIFRFEKGICRPWNNVLNAKLSLLQPNKAVRLSDGGLAIGTILGGVFILDSLQSLRCHLNQLNGLQNNTILSMYADLAGNLWLGLDKGIDLVELNSTIQWHTDLTGRLGTVYSAAVFDKKLYIGTNHGVFFKPWPSTSNGDEFRFVAGTQGQVWQLQVVDNQLLCGHNDGTFIVQNGAAKLVSGITGGWLVIPVPNRPDLLLQGTYTGLAVFRKGSDGAWTLSHRIENFGDAACKLAFDHTGNLWVAHPNRGLWKLRFDGDYSRITEIKQFGTEEGLLSNFKVDIIKYAEKLLIQSGKQLLIFKNGRFEPFEIKLPLQRRLIALNDKELFSSQTDEVVFLSDNKLTHLPIELVPGYENIIALTPDSILFCLENGYAIWCKKAKLENELIANTLKINAIEVMTDPIRRYYPIQGSAVKLQFSAKENSLRIYCAAPFYTGVSPQTWQLVGPLNKSGNLNDQPFIELTNLTAGQYSLTLSATGAVDVTYTFSIAPPWWQTWWAMILWLLLASVLIYIVEKYNRRRLKHQREQLEIEKTRELANQRKEAENEMLQAEVDNKNRELSNATLSLIRKNEALNELKNELVDLKLPSRDSGRLNRLIENHLSGDTDWEVFEGAYNQVHDNFFKKLKQQYPQLTPGDLRLAALLKLNLASKEVASLLGISVRGIENKRYRLRKKMGLNDKDNLTEILMNT